MAELHGPLNRCSFYGSKAAGDKLNHMLEAGQSQPWQQTLKEMTGTDHLDAQPMLDYFAPLYAWLKRARARHKEADDSYAEFRRRFPNYAIPPEKLLKIAPPR